MSTMTIEDQIDDFLKSGERNAWLSDDEIKIYLRNRSNRLGKTMLDIGSVEATNPGCGKFKVLLPMILDKAFKAGRDGVYIENVITPRFASFFRKEGWTECDGYGGPPSFYIINYYATAQKYYDEWGQYRSRTKNDRID